MSFLDFFFYLVAFGTVGCALGALVVRNMVHAVLFLIAAFFNASGLFLLLGAEFLAFVLIVVYVGAVALLFLFIIMTLETKSTKEKLEPFYKKTSIFVGAFLLGELVVVMTAKFTLPALTLPFINEASSNTHAIGGVLYTKYFFPFQMVGAILLVSMVGAIVLIWQKDRTSKQQNMREQASVRAQDRVHLKDVPLGEGVDT